MASNSLSTCAGQRRGAADAHAQGQGDRDRGVDHAAVELRDGRQDGRLPLEDLLQHVAHRVQRFHQHDRAADQQRQQQPNGQHVAVKHGQQHGEPVGGNGLQHDPAALDVVEQVAVREHRALGPAGRAGGVNDHRQVGLGTLGKRRTCDFGPWLRQSAPVPSSCSTRNSFRVRAGGLQGAVMRAQLGIGDQQVNARVAQNEIHLVGLEEVVDRHDHRAGLQDAEEGRE